MYKVLDKDIIEKEILPHLSTAKRGFTTKSCLLEIVNSILYKLKTGIQWHLLPLDSLFSGIVLSYKTVYYHFRKWSKQGDREKSWLRILDRNKSKLDLSTASIDGSHTKALRGGEQVEFQTRKKSKTTNSLYLTDNQGLPIAISSPVSGNHHDLHEIDKRLDELFLTLKDATITTDGLFVNADAGFDSENFRNKCSQYGIITNTALNPRNKSLNENVLFDDELYERRYSIERANAWMDSYRTILNRFERLVQNWKSFNYIAFIVIFLKYINKNKKCR